MFGWRPDRRYDVGFFGFWLSHVPPERFAWFWSLVADCLQQDGSVFFVDDGYRTVEELIEGEDSPVVQRRLNDGTAYRIVKVPYQPEDLEQQLDRIGWRQGSFHIRAVLLGSGKPRSPAAGSLSQRRPRGAATALSTRSCREPRVDLTG